MGRHATLLSVIRFVKESCAATQMTDAWATSIKQWAITGMLRGIGSVLLGFNIIKRNYKLTSAIAEAITSSTLVKRES